MWADKKKIGDPQVIKDLLKAIVKKIKMTPHGEPYVITYPTPELGFTAFMAVQLLYESYIIYDNWIELGYANMIVNSCNDYDEDDAVEVIADHLDPDLIKVSHQERYTGER